MAMMLCQSFYRLWIFCHAYLRKKMYENSQIELRKMLSSYSNWLIYINIAY